ncbi:segregation and condensation protein A [Bifidobacterium sp.]|jgi:segregation and condensation protein A|uniref:segregation and condensation protein A n=1 Tax=Bifidobacterium sp. TaxID=41200 RepID=UPI0025C27784|nr:ScpA family protein [Bifidobacterium sp.]MCH4209303.1 segregation/condensation protein A [Bifidobacterium sp.]MCI1224097.1 segregation/condensation protein A [Bifidobacterium sp.]
MMLGAEGTPVPGFHVDVEGYAGPFDVLLDMIANRRLELTELSLSAITEEFLAYVRRLGQASAQQCVQTAVSALSGSAAQPEPTVRSTAFAQPMSFAQHMDEASAFLDVASILVEAKSAALLPGDDQGERDEQSIEALRERDLLFARLVQYRAFKRAANDFRVRFAANSGRFPHPALMDDAVSAMLPELIWTLEPNDLAALAAQVFANAPADEVSLHQLHVPMVDLKAQSALVRERLRSLGREGAMTFAELSADAASRIEAIARFLAILAFFKQGALQFKQSGPFETLYIRWATDADEHADLTISEGDFA